MASQEEVARKMLELKLASSCPVCGGKVSVVDTDKVYYDCGHYLGNW